MTHIEIPPPKKKKKIIYYVFSLFFSLCVCFIKEPIKSGSDSDSDQDLTIQVKDNENIHLGQVIKNDSETIQPLTSWLTFWNRSFSRSLSLESHKTEKDEKPMGFEDVELGVESYSVVGSSQRNEQDTNDKTYRTNSVLLNAIGLNQKPIQAKQTQNKSKFSSPNMRNKSRSEWKSSGTHGQTRVSHSKLSQRDEQTETKSDGQSHEFTNNSRNIEHHAHSLWKNKKGGQDEYIPALHAGNSDE